MAERESFYYLISPFNTLVRYVNSGTTILVASLIPNLLRHGPFGFIGHINRLRDEGAHLLGLNPSCDANIKN